MLKPIKLLPAFKDNLWGGTKLKTKYNKKTDMEIVAESWELSTHKSGQSVVCGGEYDGLTLGEYIERAGKEVIGENAMKFDFFPILIKFIDAKDNLSVQVHPNDEYALANEGEYGKTEMWYILECDEGACLYYGLNREISREEFAERIKNNTLVEVLNKVPVKKGDVFFIEAGTIHAINKGILLCEIQQNSNTTYRVYDYDRRDKDGNARELHIDKAIAVSTLRPAPKRDSAVSDKPVNMLASCKYFTVEQAKITSSLTLDIDTNCFRSLIITDGDGMLEMNGETMPLSKGDSIFIPAQNGSYTISGNLEVIISRV